MNTDEMELMDEDEGDSFEEVVTRQRGRGSATRRGQKPIENADQIPLFPNADKKQINCVSYIKVLKTDRPNRGYKGMLPPTSTEETLLNEFGAGVYTIQGCNDQHQILTERHEIYIAGETEPKPDNKNGHPGSEHNTELAIKMANRQAELSLARQEETHREVMKILSNNNSNTQGTLTQFFEKVQESQGNFFTAMAALNQESKLQQAQMFQQTIALMTMGHQQNMEFIRASNDREREMSNPMLMVQLLMQGLQLGKEFGENNDQEPWVMALDKGKEMLGSLVQLKTGSPLQLPNPPNFTQMKPNPGQVSQTDKTNKNQGKPVFSKNEIHKLIEIKKKLLEKNLDLEDFLANIEIVFQPSDDELPDDEEKSDVIPDENESETTDSNDSGGYPGGEDSSESV